MPKSLEQFIPKKESSDNDVMRMVAHKVLREDMLEMLKELLPEVVQEFKDSIQGQADEFKKGLTAYTGPEGKPGKTPKKGLDYFTPEEIQNFAQQLLQLATPRKGEHYSDGKLGPKGDTGRPGKDGRSVSIEDVKKVILDRLPSLVPKLEDFKKLITEYIPEQRVERIVKKVSGGGMGNVQHELKSVSSSTTSVQTNFKIAGSGYAIWAYYNGQEIHRGTHYTVGSDFKTLTLTFTPQDDTQISLIYIRT